MVEADGEDLVRANRGVLESPSTTSTRPPPSPSGKEPQKARAARLGPRPIFIRRNLLFRSSLRSPASCESALNHSAWISTGLPRRGVTGRPSTRASIHVSASPAARRLEEAVVVHADAVARAAVVPRDDVLEDGEERLSRGRSRRSPPRTSGHRLEVPERRVDGVVLGRLARVREAVRQHALDPRAARTRAGSPRATSGRPVASASPGSAIIVSRPQSSNHG